jgi:hypothetical protein
MALQLEERKRVGPESTPPVESARRLGRSTYLGLLGVFALQGGVIGWYVGHNWFLVDDFVFLIQARVNSLTYDYLRIPLYEHFSPVHRLADWLLVHGTGPSWPVAAVVLVTLSIACSAAFAYLVSSITRRPSIIVGTTAVYAISLFFIRTGIWWTAGIHLMFVTLFSMLAIGGYVRWHSRRSKSSLVLSICALALALLTHEDAMLVLGFLVLLRALVLTPHPRTPRELLRAFLDEWPVWAIYTTLTAIAAWNFYTYYWEQQPGPTLRQFADYLQIAVGQGFFSTLFLVKVPEAMIHSPTLTALAVSAVVLTVVVITIRARVGAWRAWLFFAIALVATAIPLGMSRVEHFGVTIGRDPVYFLGPAYLFLLVVAAVAEAPRRHVTNLRRGRSKVDHRRRLILVGLVAIAYAGLFLRAAGDVAGTSQSAATHRYYVNLRHDVDALRARGTDPVLFDAQVPWEVVPDWLFPYNRYDFAVALMLPSLRYDNGHAQYLIGSDGKLQHVVVQNAFSEALPDSSGVPDGWTGGPGDCVSPTQARGQMTVNLPQPISGVAPVVRLDYRTLHPGTALVTAGGHAPRYVKLGRGGTSFSYVEGSGPIGAVSIDVPRGACIERLSVGHLVPDVS